MQELPFQGGVVQVRAGGATCMRGTCMGGMDGAGRPARARQQTEQGGGERVKGRRQMQSYVSNMKQ